MNCCASGSRCAANSFERVSLTIRPQSINTTRSQIRSARWLAHERPVPVVLVSASSDDAAQRLFRDGYDVLEDRSGTDLFVVGDTDTFDQLRASGFRPTIFQTLRPALWSPPPPIWRNRLRSPARPSAASCGKPAGSCSHS